MDERQRQEAAGRITSRPGGCRMMTWPERIANYERVMKQPSYMWTEGRWAIGVWSMGNSYTQGE